jgi:hypothetical protein
VSACGEATLAYHCHRPFAYIVVPKNLSQGGASEIDSAASAGRKTPEREKLFGRQESVGEIPSWRGEIVAIVIAIALDFIRIIIIPSPAPSSPSSPRHPAVTS